MTEEELDNLSTEARLIAYVQEGPFSPEIERLRSRIAEVKTIELERKDLLYKLILLIDIMKCDVACFYYKKQDGTVREAYGTIKNSIIEYYLSLSGQRNKTNKEKAPSPSVITYFDIYKLEWRCFKIENIIRIDTSYVI